jgi:hypothetical protein
MLNRNLSIILFMVAAVVASAQTTTLTKGLNTPPYQGTIFLDPDIITPDDPSSFESLTPTGQGIRKMFDRRVNDWVTVNAYLFAVNFDDDLSTEVQVNPEFGNSALARVEAEKYARVIGQLPKCLRKDVRTVSIHKGIQPFGGGNNNILIHVGQSDLYVRDGILEETLVHESTHTSLDATYALSVDWLRAQQFDNTFISTYAKENPKREDLAETFLLYMAVTLRADRLSDELKQTISNTISNRLNFLESLGLDFYPLVGSQEKEKEIPAEVETPTEVTLPTAQLDWIAYQGSVPENSVNGGHENGNDFAVCRAFYNGATHPGKLLADKCNIGWGGKEIEMTSFEVLVNSGVPLTWATYNGSIPLGAVQAGDENGNALFVGQFTRPDGSVHTGKVLGKPGNYFFNFGYGGKEITEKSNFRILAR